METTTTPPARCPTCGCEILARENDGVFGDECEFCEWRRYDTQPELLAALDYLLEQTVDMDLAYGIELTEGERDARVRALAAINNAYGIAA